VKTPRGDKRERVLQGIAQLLNRPGGFRLAELEQSCTGVSRDMVRLVLREQQQAGVITCAGRGPGAVWMRANEGNELPLSEGNNEGNNQSGQASVPATKTPRGQPS
jgi:hypothetical protein